MSAVHIRPAQLFDAGAMATLLNALPRRKENVDAAALRDWMGAEGIWHVAERGGRLCGFQWIGARTGLPHDTCEIATFMASDETGIDAGSALFEATRRAAGRRGYRWISATFGADNDGARAYYRSRGFEEVARHDGTRPGLAEEVGVNQVVTLYRV